MGGGRSTEYKVYSVRILRPGRALEEGHTKAMPGTDGEGMGRLTDRHRAGQRKRKSGRSSFRAKIDTEICMLSRWQNGRGSVTYLGQAGCYS